MIDIDFVHSNGRRERIRKVSPVQTRRGAEQFERQIREQLLSGSYGMEEKEVPKFGDWFWGRFWREHVIGSLNKPSEQESKESIYRCHLKKRFHNMRLDEIASGGHIADFRASLVERSNRGEISLKRINNILAVLSKALRYAEDQRIIPQAPKVGLFKLERPEIEWWEVEEYSRLLAAAKAEDSMWYAAVCIAGEAGLRVGEIRALIWERDIDLTAGTLTVNEQIRKGITGTPKGRTRRKIPMTTALVAAIKSLSVVRREYVVRNEDGSPYRDGQTSNMIYRICRLEGLPERAWHCLRHSFGTHSALFGVNPWRLQSWMGHKTITETLRYVHVAEDHMRPLPDEILEDSKGMVDPDRRILKMLAARCRVNRPVEERFIDMATAH